MKPRVFGFLLIIIVIVVGYIYITSRNNPVGEYIPLDEGLQYDSGDYLNEEDDFLNIEPTSTTLDGYQQIIQNPLVNAIELVDILGENNSAQSYILSENGVSSHVIVANLPLPENGQVYEGWLVNPKTNDFFSTGVLDQNPDGSVTLLYQSIDEHVGYDKVVVTLETDSQDGIPEVHVLEGSYVKPM